MSQEDIERMMAAQQPAPAPVAPQPQAVQQMPIQPQAMPQMPMQQPQGMPPYGYPPMYYPGYPYPMQQPNPKLLNATPVEMQEMQPIVSLGKEQSENLELILEVPLQISVEIGRTRREVQDILEFAKGSLVVLDKLAGDQVDLFVNGKCIAKGDVVVVDDNFGVRITEIVQKTGLEAVTTAQHKK
jgi:flagellar motor switch protein FliN/FliY